jgi:opacity protein-like surface antigen
VLRFWLSALATMLCCVSAWAQSTDHVEVFGGYSFVTGDFTGTFADRSTHLLNGWNASAAFKPNRFFSFVADFSGYYPSYTEPGVGALTFSARSHSFLFGPQASLRLSKVEPFAHVLLGLTHVSYPVPSGGGCPQCVASSDNSFAYALGGGIDFDLTHHFALRGQADLFHNGFSSSDNQLTYRFHQWNARISTGLVFRF